MNPIRIAIFGAGGNTREKHIPLLRAMDGVEIAGTGHHIALPLSIG